MSYGLFQHSGKTTTLSSGGSSVRGNGGQGGCGAEAGGGGEGGGARLVLCSGKAPARSVWFTSNHHAPRIYLALALYSAVRFT